MRTLQKKWPGVADDRGVGEKTKNTNLKTVFCVKTTPGTHLVPIQTNGDREIATHYKYV